MNNLTNFNAIPVGYGYEGTHRNFGERTSFWSSTSNGRVNYNYHYRIFSYNEKPSMQDMIMWYSFSVRCLKDN